MPVVSASTTPEILIPPETPTVEEQIRSEAQLQGFDPDLATLIAKCESGFKPKAKNPNSSASGVFQFIRSTWKETIINMGLPEDSDVFATTTNIRAGVWLLKQAGTRPWDASSSCWHNAYKNIQEPRKVSRVGLDD